MEKIKRLDVYEGDQLIGQLIDDKELQFIYADSWINEQQKSISLNLLISKKIHTGDQVEAFFENLLPEAGMRDFLKIKHQVSTTFGLLAVLGGDTASNLTLLTEGQLPSEPEYQKIDWHNVAQSFNNNPKNCLSNKLL